MPNSLGKMSIIELLSASPYPLSVTDIASTLGVDEKTAAKALRLMADGGRARMNGYGWIIR